MSSSADFNLNTLKDTMSYDYSCFLARLDEYRQLMTHAPWADLARRLGKRVCLPVGAGRVLEVDLRAHLARLRVEGAHRALPRAVPAARAPAADVLAEAHAA